MPEITDEWPDSSEPARSAKVIAVVWIAIIVLVVPRIADGFVYVAGTQDNYDRVQYVPSIVAWSCDALLILALTWLAGLSWREIGFQKLSLSDFFLAMLIGIFWAIALERVGPVGADETWYRNWPKPPPGVLGGVLVTLYFLAGAFSEELLFRGLLIPQIRKISGSRGVAVFISSLLFGIAHLYQGQTFVVIAFVCSMIVGTLYLGYPRIVPFAIGHAICNLLLEYEVLRT